MTRTVYGFGVNDAGYQVKFVINGKTVACPFYERWKGMLRECYSKKAIERRPSFSVKRVCREWMSFATFKAWMEKQEWQGMELDCDLLSDGRAIYSPETCLFIPNVVNRFMADSFAIRGAYPVGVHKVTGKNCFQSRCRNPITGKKESVGYFDNPDDAHNAWRLRKHEIACMLADMQKNNLVADALRQKYAIGQTHHAPGKDW